MTQSVAANDGYVPPVGTEPDPDAVSFTTTAPGLTVTVDGRLPEGTTVNLTIARAHRPVPAVTYPTQVQVVPTPPVVIRRGPLVVWPRRRTQVVNRTYVIDQPMGRVETHPFAWLFVIGGFLLFGVAALWALLAMHAGNANILAGGTELVTNTMVDSPWWLWILAFLAAGIGGSVGYFIGTSRAFARYRYVPAERPVTGAEAASLAVASGNEAGA